MFSLGIIIIVFFISITPASVDTLIISLSILWAANMICETINDSKK